MQNLWFVNQVSKRNRRLVKSYMVKASDPLEAMQKVAYEWREEFGTHMPSTHELSAEPFEMETDVLEL